MARVWFHRFQNIEVEDAMTGRTSGAGINNGFRGVDKIICLVERKKR